MNVRKRNFWQRWLVDPVAQQLTQGVTSQKIALTLAVGAACALFPILGTTTTFCVLAGIVLRLNQPIIQAINALCFFIYFPVLVVFVRLGETLSGATHSSPDIKAMVALFRHHPGEFFSRFGVIGLHAILGWAVIAPIGAVLIYFLALPLLRGGARKIHRH